MMSAASFRVRASGFELPGASAVASPTLRFRPRSRRIACVAWLNDVTITLSTVIMRANAIAIPKMSINMGSLLSFDRNDKLTKVAVLVCRRRTHEGVEARSAR
jgi:hypothetical protein